MNYTDEIEYLYRAIRASKKTSLLSVGVDLTVEQWAILEQLRNTPGISQKGLARKTDKDPAAIMRMLSLLEVRGLIVRQNPPGNRRNHSVTLTASGASLLHKIWPISIDLRARGTRGITGSEMEEFLRILNLLRKNLERL